MSRIWTAPKTWKFKEVFSASQANQELRDNLEYLKMKPRNYALLDQAANSAPSLTTSFAVVDDSVWNVSIVTSEANEEVFVYYQASAQLATGAQYLALDVLMDGATYISTMTATPAQNGILLIYSLTAGIQYQGYFRKRVVVPTAGTHTFKLRARVLTTGCVATWVLVTTASSFGVQVE